MAGNSNDFSFLPILWVAEWILCGMAKSLSYIQLEGQSWPHPCIIQAGGAGPWPGDSVLPLRASHPAVARLASMHDTSGQYPMMAKEKAAPLKA